MQSCTRPLNISSHFACPALVRISAKRPSSFLGTAADSILAALDDLVRAGASPPPDVLPSTSPGPPQNWPGDVLDAVCVFAAGVHAHAWAAKEPDAVSPARTTRPSAGPARDPACAEPKLTCGFAPLSTPASLAPVRHVDAAAALLSRRAPSRVPAGGLGGRRVRRGRAEVLGSWEAGRHGRWAAQGTDR